MDWSLDPRYQQLQPSYSQNSPTSFFCERRENALYIITKPQTLRNNIQKLFQGVGYLELVMSLLLESVANCYREVSPWDEITLETITLGPGSQYPGQLRLLT
jgi:hypothetical protein